MMDKEKELVAPVFFGKSFGMKFGVGVSHSNIIIPDPLDRVCSVYLEMYLALNDVSQDEYNLKYKDNREWSLGFYEWLYDRISADKQKIVNMIFELYKTEKSKWVFTDSENGLQ